MSIRPTIPSGAMLLAFVALALLLHIQVLDLSFFSDDFSVIHRLGARGDLGTGSFFRPLPDWTLALNYRIAGPTPWAFRMVNVALLGLNGWLVFLLTNRLLRGTSLNLPGTATLAGLFFVAYPYHNEPQLWIIGRGTAMATSFILLALIIALSEVRASWKLLGIALFAALGTLCYETALLLPAMLLALWPLASGNDRPVLRNAIVLTTGITMLNLLARAGLTGHVANTYGTGFFAHDLADKLAMMPKVLGRLFLPPNPEPSTQLLLFGLLCALLLALAIHFVRRTRNEPLHRRVALVLIALTAIANVVAIVGGVSTRTSESDRFLYPPSAFLSMLVAVVLSSMFAPRIRVMLCATLVVASVYNMRANHQNWMEASRTIVRVIETVPNPISGRVFVHHLPSDHQGAFILRHGFHQALLFAGRDTTGILRADTLIGSFAVDRSDRGDTVLVTTHDRVIRWNGERFEHFPLR